MYVGVLYWTIEVDVVSIGERIKELRQNSNLTQEELACQLYVTRNAISKWETDRGIPSIDNLKNLSTIFNVSLDNLVNEVDQTNIAIDNMKVPNHVRDVINGITIFIGYSFNGIIIPYLLIRLDVLSINFLNWIIFPLTYIFIGVISLLRGAKWPYVIVSSALALAPIYILDDILLPTYDLCGLDIIYFNLFIVTFYCMKLSLDYVLKYKDPLKISNFYLVISIINTVLFIVDATYSILIGGSSVSSGGEWYEVMMAHIIIYCIPIILPVILRYYFKYSQTAIDKIRR